MSHQEQLIETTANDNKIGETQPQYEIKICPLCIHPCEINGQPCGIHTEEACIYT